MLFKKLHFCQKKLLFRLLKQALAVNFGILMAVFLKMFFLYFNVKIYGQKFLHFITFSLQSIPLIKIAFFVPFNHLGHETNSCI